MELWLGRKLARGGCEKCWRQQTQSTQVGSISGRRSCVAMGARVRGIEGHNQRAMKEPDHREDCKLPKTDRPKGVIGRF